MAVIAGQVTESGIGGVDNTLIGLGLRAFAVDYWPPYDSIVGDGEADALTTHFPVAASNAHALSGQVARQFSDDYYHRIHIIPRVLALGNVVSTQVDEIDVWNAYLAPMTLTGIDGTAEGFSIDGPDSFPMIFGARAWDVWEVTVAPDGPSTIDLTVTWDFSSPANDVSLHITGVRIVAWPFVPNWEQGVRETLSWATDVLPSPTAAEQRRQMRLAPRRRFEAEMIVQGRERRMFDNLVHGWGGRIWALPIWADIQRLAAPLSAGATSIPCSTSGRDFEAGSLVMLRSENAWESEVAEIATVGGSALDLARPLQQAWPAGTRIYPARPAWLVEQPRRNRHTDQVATVTGRFLLAEPSEWAALSFGTTYRGHPVYADRPDESADLTGTYERLLAMLDNVSGIPHILDTADQPFEVRAHRWVLAGITERGTFRSLLYALCGRQTAVWVPTHDDDLTVLTTIGAASTTINVAHAEYTRFGLDVVGRRDIRIELFDGTAYHVQVTGSTEIDADTEQLTISAALGATVAPADIRRVSFMALMRLASDDVEINHLTDIEGVATSRIEWRATRDDLS